MPDIEIRKFQEQDEYGLLNVCYRTGYMGEDLTDRNIFTDITLFGYLFCLYYAYYEPENCFVAVDKSNSNKVIGYIIGTTDSKRQESNFAVKMGWRIVLRLFTVTLWLHTECFTLILNFLIRFGRKYISSSFKYGPEDLYDEYPAHFHINILSEYQRCGVGSKLIEKFERHVIENKVHGIHLRTSNQNYKALPFYADRGYKKLFEDDIDFWKDVSDYKNLILAKKL